MPNIIFLPRLLESRVLKVEQKVIGYCYTSVMQLANKLQFILKGRYGCVDYVEDYRSVKNHVSSYCSKMARSGMC